MLTGPPQDGLDGSARRGAGRGGQAGPEVGSSGASPEGFLFLKFLVRLATVETSQNYEIF